MSARRRPTAQPGAPASPRTCRRRTVGVLGGLSILCLVSAHALAQSPTVDLPSARKLYDVHIAEAARRFRLPPAWIRAVLIAESAGDQRAISRKGAMGLMQIVPDTWFDLRDRYRLGRDPYDPHDNIIAGSAYIRELLDRYGSPGWIAAYNAGPGRYEASLQGRRLPRETRAYVTVVTSAIGNDGAGEAVGPAVPTQHNWKLASLFVVQPGDRVGDRSLQLRRFRDDGSEAVPKARRADAEPRSTGVFVPKASERSAQ
ncbi:lytic transglycosylase domain-containing protein [Mesorhizobium sp. M4B.F.Ca.ET.215.01.1.1]|uniref:lytic transglycosylase domain-containing protein n=1 Tax=unclassified Mesorhizobium TaxID=325217 RepID=UPI000FD3735D|nr:MULTISPECIES: lytic transglycosylase domain-containing protein [unclassified Mesorhizobium]RUW25453.1 lytic transglycosylase domain-containing protein [Mesorhizobium sp. M4B.F.Ca.ET.013.02.1.1]RWF39021.1 MAG: lytic transglycosylase domain-containing protein [Mesorhizobium sp.]RWF64814.1 MAG: lytic transglycosylase domain-containing protein [Mesorhizobium sp.]TGQ18273.1 lytic transglycosylase domain-containing protein [Mesorhizobium sp. M4B.F.Ca.ET.215.01.1.1]TGQ24502.1 lytic transglycosylas